MMKIVLNTALVLVVLWTATRDYCLVRHMPEAAVIDTGALLLGFSAQAVAVFLVYVLVNRAGRYFDFLKSYTVSATLRATFLLMPFVFLFFSHNIIAYALYNAGTNNKIESALRSDAALRACCFLDTLAKSSDTDR